MRIRNWIVGSVLLVACKQGPEKVPEGAAAGAGAEPAEVPCGGSVCRGGQVCCNPSCGICAPPDGMCTQQFCDAPRSPEDGGIEALPPAPMSCDNVRCAGGTRCEMVQVQCVRAPCDPVPQCNPEATEEK